jgi:ribosomal protein S18 acetylase RimI-like enzyme
LLERDSVSRHSVLMENQSISIRRASLDDISQIADVHAASWRYAYRGIIPGRELEKMVRHRSGRWWKSAIQRGGGLLVVDFDDVVVGYVSFGRCRDVSARYTGEIFELYLMPEFQGLGFGRRLFRGAQAYLASRGFPTLIVWALTENHIATDFYESLGGKPVKKALEHFGATLCERIAFKFEG